MSYVFGDICHVTRLGLLCTLAGDTVKGVSIVSENLFSFFGFLYGSDVYGLLHGVDGTVESFSMESVRRIEREIGNLSLTEYKYKQPLILLYTRPHTRKGADADRFLRLSRVAHGVSLTGRCLALAVCLDARVLHSSSHALTARANSIAGTMIKAKGGHEIWIQSTLPF